MIQAMRIAIHGLADAKLRLDVAANNLANVNTDGFKASRVTSGESSPYGVTQHISQIDTPAFQYTDEEGNLIESSNTDMVQEVVNMLIAEHSFKFNTAAVKTSDILLGTLLDIKI
ncbi:MAG: hypothetical protein JXD21_00885 [Candidatus Omnitrophica bacterium]|nr:hypothetical protein [Candidatus Omnitrophota bacterium]